MAKVRRTPTKNQSRIAAARQQAIPLDEGRVTTSAALEMIVALIPLGLQAVEAALLADVEARAGPRDARDDARDGAVGDVPVAEATLLAHGGCRSKEIGREKIGGALNSTLQARSRAAPRRERGTEHCSPLRHMTAHT